MFEFTTTRSFVLTALYTVTLTAYDAEGQVLTRLDEDVQIEQANVQGLTLAPDLIHVYFEGKYVYFVFDEKIHRVEDETAFFIVLYDGKVKPASAAKLEKDGVTVRAEFSSYDVRKSTLAGIEEHSVSDPEGLENIVSLMPLNNVKFGGSTEGPDLVSVKVETFELDNDDTKETIVVEYVFDEEPTVVNNSVYAAKFLLFLKDGTKLSGTGLQQKKETVTVTFDVYWDGTTDMVRSGDGTQTSKVLRKFGGVIDRDEIAVAAVLPGAVPTEKTRTP